MMSTPNSPEARTERWYMEDAERRLNKVRTQSATLFVVVLILAGAFLCFTRDTAHTNASTHPNRNRYLIAAAALAYAGARAAVNIRKATRYVDASRRALEQSEVSSTVSDDARSG